MYGESRNWRYFIGFGLLIVLLIIIIFMIMRGGNDKPKVEDTKRELTSYVNDPNVSVKETIIGPVTAAQTHDEIEIQISSSNAAIRVSKGYQGNVVNSRDYPVTTNAYSEFLYALDRAGYTKGNNDEELQEDKGYCATGERYIFTIEDGSHTIQRFWSTSCNHTKTYKGNLSLTLELFRKQIPDYGELTKDVDFVASAAIL